MATTPKVQLKFVPEAWGRLWSYIHAVPTEIGGLGYATQQDGFILVDKVFLLPQIRSTGSVDFADHENVINFADDSPDCDDAMQWALHKAIADDRVEDMCFSWHSHGSIGVCWSSTDESAIEKYGQMLPWLVSSVLNRDNKMLTRIDVFNTPLVGQVTLNDVPAGPLPDVALNADVIQEVDGLTVEKKHETKLWKGYEKKPNSGNAGGSSHTTQKQLPATVYKGPYSKLRQEIDSDDGIGLIHDPHDPKSKYDPKAIEQLEEHGYIIMIQPTGEIYAMSPSALTEVAL